MPKKSHRGNVRKSRRSHLSMLALEPRLMFDAAAAETALSDLTHADAIVQPTAMDTPHAVIVVDARVEDGIALAQAIDPNAEIVRIDLSGDGLESLASQLSDHREITTLHLITHGSQGEIELGSTVLNSETLTQHSAALATIGNAMSEGGDILLYGCDIAADGGKFMFTLSELTRTDVAASVDTTGHSGDWALEATVGNVEADLSPDSAALQAYQHDLLVSNFSSGNTTGWTPIVPANVAQYDYVIDQQTGSTSGDIVGSASFPGVYYQSDGTDVAFRVRINANDSNNATLKFNNFAFVGIDANGDGGVDVFVGVYNPTGNNGRVGIYNADPAKLNISPNTTGIVSNGTLPYQVSNPVANTDYSLVATTDGSQFSTTSADADYFISWKVPFAQLQSALAARGINITTSTPLHFIVGTAQQDNSFNVDIAGLNGITSNDVRTWSELGAFSPYVAIDGSSVPATYTAPTNYIDGVARTNLNTPLVFTSSTTSTNGISVVDPDTSVLTVSLSVTNGTFSLSGTSGLSFTSGDGASDTSMTFSGTQAAINTALSGASFSPTTSFTGTAVLTMATTDGTSTDTDTMYIAVGLAADTTAPTLSSSSPADGATGVNVSNNITLTFNESVVGGDGSITVYKSSDNSIVETFNSGTGVGSAGGTATFSGSTLTLDLASSLSGNTDYYIKVTSGAVIDLQANAYAGISTATALNFTTGAADTTAPTVAIQNAPANHNGSGAFTTTFEWSENVTGFTQSDITVSNATLSNFTTVDGNTYRVTLTPTGTGNISLSIGGSVAQDSAGNNNTASSTAMVPYASADTTPPTIVITDNVPGTADGDVTYTFTFNEAVAGFTVGDVTVAGGTKGTFTAVSATVYTLIVTPTANSTGTITVDVASNVASDAASNGNTAATQSTQAFDTQRPAVSITDNIVGTASGDVTYTFTFDEAVTGFTVDDVTVSGGTKGTFTAVSGSVYTLVVTPTANSTGNITVDVNASVADDAVGNDNTAATQSTQAFDTQRPAVTITDDTIGNASGDVTFTFTFDEPVTGFTADDVTVSNGTKGTFTAVSSTVYTLVVTPPSESTGTITVDVASNVAIDSAENGNTAAAQATQAFDTVTPDTTAPSVTITDDTVGTASGDVTFTFTFDEPVTGFTADDVTVSNGTKGTFTAVSSTVYTLVVTPPSESSGTITVDVAGNVAIDGSENGNSAAAQATQAFNTVTPDTTAPSVTITDDTVGTAPGDVTFTFTFDEPVTGFTADDVTVSNGTKGTFTAISATVYTLVVAPPSESSGTITVDVAGNVAIDGSENGNTAAAQATQAFNTVTPDTTAPSVTITDDTVGTASGDVTFTFTFDEPVTGFTADDVTVSNGTKGTFTAVSATVYTLVVTPPSESTGTITVDVASNVAIDGSENGNTAAAQATQAFNTVTPDTTAPSVTITDDTVGTASGDVTFTFTFDEPVTGFTADDVTVSNGTKGTFTAVSSTVYTLVVTPPSESSGTITVDVASNVAIDGAENGNTAAAQATQAFDTVTPDTTAPSVTITDDTLGTASGDVTFTFTFDEPVTGFTADDVTVSNGTKGTFTAVSSTVYTLVVTPPSESTGTITVDVAGNVAIDGSENGNTAAAQATQAFNTVTPDTTAPSVTITDDTVGTTSGDVTFTFTFDEPVTGFTADDVTVSNGTKGTFTAVSSTVYTLVVTPPSESTGTITVDVAGNVAIDGSENGNTAAAQATQAFNTVTPDTTAPSVTITDDTLGTASGDVTFTFTFDEPVTGFTADDVTVSIGTKGTFTAVSSTVYTLVVTPPSESTGTITVDVAGNVAIDGSENGNSAAAQATQAFDTVTPDTTAPTVTITDDTVGTASGDVTFTFTFDEPVTGFTADDVTVSNGTKGTFTAVSATVYTLVVTPPSESTGTITVDVAGNVAIDGSENGNSAAAQATRAFDTVTPDTTAPSVTITDDTVGTASGDVTFTFTFDEPVTGFTADDVTVSNGTKGTFTAVSSTIYTLVVTPPSESTGTITVDVAGNVAIDGSENGNTAAAQATQAFDTVTPDTTAPSVTITDDTVGAASGAVTFTFTFDEPVTGFTVDDVTVSNGTKGTFTAVSATVYTLVVTPPSESTGTITVDVAGNVAIDGSENGNTAAAQATQAFDTVTPDTTAPSVTITDDTVGTASGDVTFTFTFDEPVTGFTVDDVTVSNGTKGTFTAVSATVYTLVVTPPSESTGTITVDVAGNVAIDGSENGNTAAAQATQAFDTVTPDTTAPSVTITDDTVGTASGDVTFTFTFDEPVTGFTADDVTVSNGTKGTFTAVSSTIYTLVVTPPSESSGTITVDVASNVAIDGSENGNSAAAQATQAFDTVTPDTTAPSVTITDDTLGTASADVTFTFTFDEPVTGFTADDVTVSSGTKGTFTAVSATVYTLVVTPPSESSGTITVDVAGNVAIDGSENGNSAAAQATQAFNTVTPDSTAPSVTITDDTLGTASGDVTFTFTFDEPVTGFTADDVTVSNGTKGTFTAVSSTVYTLVVTPPSESSGTITVDVASNVAIDGAENGNTAAAQATQAFDTVTPDTTAPSVTITDDTVGSTSGDVTFTFTFDEPVTGFTADDVTVSNGTKGTFTAVSSTIYTLVVTPPSESTGTITVDVAGNVAIDGSENGNSAASQATQAFDTVTPDTTAPSVTITDDTVGTASGDVTFTFTFDEPVTGFTADDVTVSNGTKGTFTAVSSTVYTLVVTPPSESTGTITVDVAGNVAIDGSENGNTAAAQVTQAFDTVTPDTTAPSVTITDDTVGTASGDVTFTFTFDEPVTGFTADDVTVSNGTKGTFTAVSSTVYTLVVTPPSESTGTITVDVAGNVAIDGSENGNTAAAQATQAFDTVTPDTTAPSVTITDDTVGTASGDMTFTFTFDEPVTGFTADDVTVSNGTKGTFTAVSSTVYTLVVTPPSESTGTITVDVAGNVAIDSSENGNTAAAQATQAFDTVTPDTTAPSVTITDDTVGTASGDVTFTFTFDEPVTGFTADDVTVSNGTKGTFTAVSSTVYTLVVTPPSESTGTITVDVAGNVAIDSAENGNTAAAQATQAFDTVTPDTTAPSVTITDDTVGAASGAVTFTFTFDEPVTGFTADDVTVSNGTKGTFTAVSSTVYTLVVTPPTESSGTITVDVASNVAIDGSENGNTAAAQATQAFNTVTPDTTAPSVTITDDTLGTASGDVTFTFTFDEPVTGFTADDVTVSNGTKGTFTAVSSTVYTLVVTPPSESTGTITVDVAGNVAIDGSENGNTAAAQATQAFDTVTPDTTAPSVTITDDTVGTASGDVTFTFTFDEPVTGFTADDVTVSNGTKGTFTAVSSTVYTLVVTPPSESTGTITVDVASNVAIDGAENGNSAAAQATQAFNTVTPDTTAPSVTITDDTVGTASGDVTFTFTFDEPVTGFTADDVTVSNGTKGTFTAVSSTIYTLVVTPPSESTGTITVDVAGNVAIDSSENGNTAAAQATQAFDTVTPDTTAPSVTITDDSVGTASGDVTFTFTFDEPVTGFTADDVTVSNGTKGTFTAISSTVYTLVVTPPAESTGTITVDVASNVAIDGSENGNSAAAQATQAFNTVTPDTTAPSVTITDDTVGTASGDVTFTFTFDEPVTGFTADDVTVSNGTKGTFTAVSSTVYTLVVTPPSESTGTITVDVAGNVAIDSAENGNTAAAQATQAFNTVTPDTTAPSVTITDNTASTASGDVTFTFTFSEPVIGFTVDDVTVTNGTKGVLTQVSPSVYTLVVTPAANSVGTITVDVAGSVATDAGSNGNTAATQAVQTFDRARPDVVITDNAAGTASGAVVYTFTFNEAVTGFTADDIVVAGGTKGTFTALSPTVYTLVVTPPSNSTGTITVDVADNRAADAASNGNRAATRSTQLFDTTRPSVAITDSAADTASGPVLYTFTFDEAVTGFSADDISVTGGAKGTFTAVSPTLYTLQVTPPANRTGSIVVEVSGNAANDAAGNGSTATSRSTQAFDTTQPSVIISHDAVTTATGDVLFTFTFNEPVNGFSVDDIVVSGGSKGVLTTVSPTTFTLVVTPAPDSFGTITVDVAALAAADGAGNGSSRAAQSTQAFDTREIRPLLPPAPTAEPASPPPPPAPDTSTASEPAPSTSEPTTAFDSSPTRTDAFNNSSGESVVTSTPASTGILTQGFPISVVTLSDAGSGLGESALLLNQGMTDRFLNDTGVFKFTVPADAFAHTNPDARITLSATLADGSPLPSWIQFSAQDGRFTVTPNGDVHGAIQLRVLARDQDGHEAVAIFRVVVDEAEKTTAVIQPIKRMSVERLGKPSLSEQLGRVSLNARHGTALNAAARALARS